MRIQRGETRRYGETTRVSRTTAATKKSSDVQWCEAGSCSGVRLAAVELAEFPVKKNMSCDHVNT